MRYLYLFRHKKKPAARPWPQGLTLLNSIVSIIYNALFSRMIRHRPDILRHPPEWQSKHASADLIYAFLLSLWVPFCLPLSSTLLFPYLLFLDTFFSFVAFFSVSCSSLAQDRILAHSTVLISSSCKSFRLKKDIDLASKPQSYLGLKWNTKRKKKQLEKERRSGEKSK